jgi:hypothetical protein
MDGTFDPLPRPRRRPPVNCCGRARILHSFHGPVIFSHLMSDRDGPFWVILERVPGRILLCNLPLTLVRSLCTCVLSYRAFRHLEGTLYPWYKFTLSPEIFSHLMSARDGPSSVILEGVPGRIFRSNSAYNP